MENSPVTILVVEDDPNDTLLVRRAFKKSQNNIVLQICKDGQEAKEYLSGVGQYSDRTAYPFPRILITDLKMPRVNGLELLKWLRDQKCAVMPKIVFSASPQTEDIQQAYDLGASCYLCKPTSFDRLMSLIQLLLNFWNEVLLPEVPKHCADKQSV